MAQIVDHEVSNTPFQVKTAFTDAAMSGDSVFVQNKTPKPLYLLWTEDATPPADLSGGYLIIPPFFSDWERADLMENSFPWTVEMDSGEYWVRFADGVVGPVCFHNQGS